MDDAAHAPPDHFADRLMGALDRVGAPACVGIDPVLDRMPRGLIEQVVGGEPLAAAHVPRLLLEFSAGVVNAAAGVVPVVKFQSACYERFGEGGVAALRRSIALARQSGLIVILDAKRGDIGISAEHYASAAFDAFECPMSDADAITLSGYLGADTIEPFLAHTGRGVFLLVRTSNTGSDGVQSLALDDGRSVAEMMADMVSTLGESRMGQRGLSCVGAVVGATKAADAAELRERMPEQVFLVPGYGAQGGTIDDIRPMLRADARGAAELGVLVTASRSVIYPAAGASDWIADIRAAAERFADEVRTLVA